MHIIKEQQNWVEALIINIHIITMVAWVKQQYLPDEIKNKKYYKPKE